MHWCQSKWDVQTCCCGNWCHNHATDQEWKRLYPCCAGSLPPCKSLGWCEGKPEGKPEGTQDSSARLAALVFSLLLFPA